MIVELSFDILSACLPPMRPFYSRSECASKYIFELSLESGQSRKKSGQLNPEVARHQSKSILNISGTAHFMKVLSFPSQQKKFSHIGILGSDKV